MVDDNLVFEEGYNRLKSDIRDYKYDEPIKFDLLGRSKETDIDSKAESTNAQDHKVESESNKKSAGSRTLDIVPKVQSSKGKISKQTNAKSTTPIFTNNRITNIHDPKNQLSSLIRNAQQNKDALEQRNRQKKKTKQLSKSRYGW